MKLHTVLTNHLNRYSEISIFLAICLDKPIDKNYKFMMKWFQIILYTHKYIFDFTIYITILGRKPYTPSTVNF